MTETLDAALKSVRAGATKAVDLKNRLSAHAALLRRDRDAARFTEDQIALAKSRVALKPEIESIFQDLRNVIHERSVGHFEELMKGLVEDVLPDAGVSIRFSPNMSRSQPSLDIVAMRGEFEESILDGNGGALTNIVSAGLRIVAASRAAGRRFMVFDEADCWIQPDRVAAFAETIHKASRAIGMQTLVITHHDPDLFPEEARVIRLARDTRVSSGNEELEASPVLQVLRPGVASNPSSLPPSGDLSPLSLLRLTNFMGHEATDLHLHPGMTVIVGDNNIGKSAIVAAIRAIAGDGTIGDNAIRHGAPSCSVSAYPVEQGMLTWTRNLSGSPKAFWKLSAPQGDLERFGAGQIPQQFELVRETPATRNETPDWVKRGLGIYVEPDAAINSITIKIGHQKSPIFLLNETGAVKASILSIGRDSEYLDKMVKNWTKQLQEDRFTIKNGEPALARLRREIEARKDASWLEQQIGELLRDGEAITHQIETVKEIYLLIASLQNGEQRLKRSGQVMAAFQGMSELPATVTDQLAALDQMIAAMRTMSIQVSALDRLDFRLSPYKDVDFDDPTILTEVEVAERCGEIGSILASIRGLQVAENRARAAGAAYDEAASAVSTSAEPLASIEQLKDADRVLETLRQMSSLSEQISKADADLAQIRVNLGRLEREKSEIDEEFEDVCPTCSAPRIFGHQHDDTASSEAEACHV